MTIAVGLLSLVAVDAGYVLVIPLGGVIFYAAGRHPIAGIAAAFAAISGGFCANYVPTALDTILAGLTETGARIVDPKYSVNPLCNYMFTIASSVLVIGLGWFLTDKVIEPRLRRLAIDGDPHEMPKMESLSSREEKGLLRASLTMLAGLVLLVILCLPDSSPFRGAGGGLTERGSPLLGSIVPLILLLFLLPGMVYGYVAGTFKTHRDVVQAMTKTMNTMGYYMVMAFCAAMFIYAFNTSNLGRDGCQRTVEPGTAHGCHHRGDDLRLRLRQSADGILFREVDAVGSDLRPDADAAGHLTGVHAGRLSHR
jgi:aminobenzoyl-glutamate transport protein